MESENNNQPDKLDHFLKGLASAKIPVERSKESMRRELSEAVEKQISEEKLSRIWRLTGIAATFLVMTTFLLLFFNSKSNVDVRSLTSEIVEEILPDSSSVLLNAESSLSYSKDWNRKVRLEGEAFFNVVSGQEFEVTTKSGSVQVFGTSFNVYNRDNKFVVACKTGLIKVSTPQNNFVKLLKPGEVISIQDGNINESAQLPEMIGLWQKGEFFYKKQPIQEVLNEIERQFNVDIEYQDLSKRYFTGYFRNNDIETALKMVCLPLSFEWQKVGQSKYRIYTNSK